MMLYDFISQHFPDTGRSTGAYIVFYQGGTIDHCTHVPDPVAQSSTKNEYNTAWNTVMDITQFGMLNIELMNKDTDVVPEKAPLIILDRKSAVCMANNSKDTKK